jgi:3-methyl-2-oxobutanoate hydroxymethyltransferase
MLGLNVGFNPRFLRRYLNLFEDIKGAVGAYVDDVKKKDFPNATEQY